MAEADASTWFLSRRNPLAMARRLVELEIINPSKPKPNRDDYDPDAYKEELKNWQEEENKRTKRLVTDLRRIFLEAPRDFEKDWNIRIIYKAVAGLLARMRVKQKIGKSEFNASQRAGADVAELCGSRPPQSINRALL